MHPSWKRFVGSLLIFGQISLPATLAAQDANAVENEIRSLKSQVKELQSQAELTRMTGVLTLCILEKGSREACGQLDEAEQSSLEAATASLPASASAITALVGGEPVNVGLIDVSTQLATALNSCGAGEASCDVEGIQGLTQQLGAATDAARAECRKLPSPQKEQCLKQVDDFAEKVPDDLARVFEILGPVVAVCAASLGLGCAMMALFALAQLFGDSGGGSGGSNGPADDGSGGEQQQAGGNPGVDNTATPAQKIAEQAAQGTGWTYRDVGNDLFLEKDDKTVQFQLPGWNTAPAEKVEGINEQAKEFAEEIATMAVSDWLATREDVSKFFVDDSTDGLGVAVCAVAGGPGITQETLVEWIIFRENRQAPDTLIIDTKQAACPVQLAE